MAKKVHTFCWSNACSALKKKSIKKTLITKLKIGNQMVFDEFNELYAKSFYAKSILFVKTKSWSSMYVPGQKRVNQSEFLPQSILSFHMDLWFQRQLDVFRQSEDPVEFHTRLLNLKTWTSLPRQFLRPEKKVDNDLSLRVDQNLKRRETIRNINNLTVKIVK